MSISPDAIAHARSINLIEFLIARGHKPVSRRPHHADFHAPYREDRNPSFSVSQRPDGTWVWYDFGRNEHEGCKQHGDLIDLVQLLDHVPFAEALHRILHNTVRSMVAPSNPSTAPPTDKERIAHAKKLYYAAQANMTPEREEELRSYFHKLALPYNQHLGAVWMRLGDDGIPYVAFPLPTPNIHFMQGETGRALGYFAKALEDDPDMTSTLANTAWILATAADDKLRDAPKALQQATRAVELSKREDPSILQVLAGAQASAGEFDQAVATCVEAAKLARAKSNEGLASSIEALQRQFEQKQPFRQSR